MFSLFDKRVLVQQCARSSDLPEQAFEQVHLPTVDFTSGFVPRRLKPAVMHPAWQPWGLPAI